MKTVKTILWVGNKENFQTCAGNESTDRPSPAFYPQVGEGGTSSLYPHQVADDHVADEEALVGEAQAVLRETKESLVEVF